MFQPGGPTFLELARQALSSTDDGYDLLASKFDRTPFRTPDPIVARTLAEIGEPVGQAIDLCTGTGAALPHLAPFVRQRLVGIDRSEGMLAQARERAARLDGPEVVLERGDALTVPEAHREAFDVATCFGAFGHIPEADEPRFVDAVAARLKPGGRFVFVTSAAPPLLSLRNVVARSFNGAMRVRNALLKPPFIMYYLTFLWPQCGTLLERAGFAVRCVHDAFEGRMAVLKVVVGTKV